MRGNADDCSLLLAADTEVMMKRIAIGSALLAVILCCQVPVALADMTQSQARHLEMQAEQGDAEALHTLRQRASAGDAVAQNFLGDFYKHGQGVKRDYSTAAAWYQKAATQGYALAQSNLGFLYYQGRGVSQDYAKAAAWWKKAAKQGDMLSQSNLGVLYYKGQGVAQDYGKAAQLWLKAADQGDGSSQYNMGYAYYKGQGVPRDFVEAYKWLTLAASKRSRKGIRDAALATREVVAGAMTNEQISNAQQLSKNWKPKQ